VGSTKADAVTFSDLSRNPDHDRLGDLVAGLREIHGPVTEEELAPARAEWPGM
jgi:hypothetical protein